jgi:rfaE bifunctional protein nucleotidyltransferase chain/domain
MIIGLSSDHNGVELKTKMAQYLRDQGDFKVIDIGPFSSTKKVDYVDYASQLSQMVSNGDLDRAILICGTGVGMSIAANRFEKVRAALVHNVMTAPKCREHNNSNVLCLGAWTTSEEENFEILDLWLQTIFGEGRHVKRVEKLSSHRANIVFTSGVFDILHAGHIELLRFAKSLGDRLIVGLNSDESVKRIKGPHRPITRQEDRKGLLEALLEVDEVVIFDADSPADLISDISPTILVKGGEWTVDEIRSRDSIPAEIEIKVFPIVGKYSTTNIINQISQVDDGEKQ